MLGIVQATDLRLVRLYWKGSGFSEYLVPAQELTRFTNASLRLHHEPGKNPHNGNDAARIGALRAEGPYWWSTPDLKENGDPKGAHLYDWNSEEEVWVLPGFDLEKAMRVRDDAKNLILCPR